MGGLPPGKCRMELVQSLVVRDDSWYVFDGFLPPGIAEVEKWFTETRGMCFVGERVDPDRLDPRVDPDSLDPHRHGKDAGGAEHVVLTPSNSFSSQPPVEREAPVTVSVS